MNTYEIEAKTATHLIDSMEMSIENGILVLFNRDGEKNNIRALFKEWNHVIKNQSEFSNSLIKSMDASENPVIVVHWFFAPIPF